MDSTVEFASGGVLANETLIQPVILAGGPGTRLWPLSRKAWPKPLSPVLSERTLLRETVARPTDRRGFGSPLIVCGHDHCGVVVEQLASVKISPPCGSCLGEDDIVRIDDAYGRS